MVMPNSSRQYPLHPTLLIGLGGTGTRILTQVRRHLNTRFGQPALPFLRMLAIDSDVLERGQDKNREELGEILTAQEFFHLAPLPLQHGLPPNVLEWFPHLESPSPAVNSFELLSRGHRPFGRLLWFIHHATILEKIEELLLQLRSLEVLEESMQWLHARGLDNIDVLSPEGVEVALFTSLSGSTGGAIFLDCAFLLRHLQLSGRSSGTTCGYLFLASPAADSVEGCRQRANIYAALQELERFTCRPYGETRDFEVEWEAGRRLSIPGPPFDEVYLIDTQLESGLRVSPEQIEDVFEGCASFVVDRTIPGVYSTALRCMLAPLRVVRSTLHAENGEHTSVIQSRAYACFGTAEIGLRRDRTVRVLGLRLEKSILNCLLNGAEDNGGDQALDLSHVALPSLVFEDLSALMDTSVRRAIPIRPEATQGSGAMREWVRRLYAINLNEIRVALKERAAALVRTLMEEFGREHCRLFGVAAHGINRLVDWLEVALDTAADVQDIQRTSGDPQKASKDDLIHLLGQELMQLSRPRWPDLFRRRSRRIAEIQDRLEGLILDDCRARLFDDCMTLTHKVTSEVSLGLFESLSALRELRDRINVRLDDITDEELMVLKPEDRTLVMHVVPRREEFDRFNTLSFSDVRPAAELRQCIEEMLVRGVDLITAETIPGFLSHCTRYCNSRFASDFQLHPHNFEVLSGFDDSSVAASWLAFRSSPLLKVARRASASWSPDSFSILCLPNPQSRRDFLTTLRQKLAVVQGSVSMPMEVVDCSSFERITLRTLRVGLPLCNVWSVIGECEHAYEGFLAKSGSDAIETLYLDRRWRADTVILGVPDEEDVETAEVLLFAPMLQVLGLETTMGRKAFFYRRGAPFFMRERLGVEARARIVLRRDAALRKVLLSECRRREAQLTAEVKIAWASALCQFVESLENRTHESYLLLKKIDVLSGKGTEAVAFSYNTKEHPVQEIEWREGYPILIGLSPWQQ
jgi:hypothetical protein